MNNTGSTTIPATLPLQTLCDQISLIPGDSNGVVLFHRRYAAYPAVGILGGQGGSEAAAASSGPLTAESSGTIAGGGKGTKGKELAPTSSIEAVERSAAGIKADRGRWPTDGEGGRCIFCMA